MKKLLSILLALTMVLSLGVPAFAADAHEITSAAFPIYHNSVSLGMDVKLCFLDGAADLPYIEANDFLTLLDALILGSKDHDLSFSMESDGPVVTYIRRHPAEGADDNGATMVLDFDQDTIFFKDYNLFCKQASSSTLLDMTRMNVFNAAGEPAALQKLENGTLTRYGHELTLPLGEYGIDLVRQDGLYLIPLQTLSDFIVAPVGSGIYFNGQCVIFSGNVKEFAEELYYAAPTGERSEALAAFGYNELCLMLDYMYGMKDTHEIESFREFFHDTGLESLLKGANAEYADRAVWRMITDFFDDLHSDWHGYSYLAGPVDVTVPDGPSVLRRSAIKEDFLAAREKYYPDGIPGYEEIGNTAYITFDRFYLADQNGDQFYQVEDPEDFDDYETVGLIMKAHARINREGSPIENVVIDLSCNGGGHADAAVFTIAWFLGEASIGMKDTMTHAMCSSTYRCDANRDRKFDDSDTVKDKNLFCLVSPVSFSCGNLVPCIFKESDRVTLIGRPSGGGACPVLNASTAWGTSFQISSNLRLSFLKNGSFYDVDRGAEPDFALTRFDQFYDRAALTDYINSLCWAK